MWACPIVSVAVAACLLIVNPVALFGAGPVLLMWLLAPMIAWTLSQPTRTKLPQFSEEEKLCLGRWARQTWHFFETHVGRQTHWLPPDNFQEGSRPMVVSRHQSTNIGMGLLANLTACDLGYLPPSAMLDRSARMLRSMLHMEQFRGHFYNWYDTATLRPAEPRYVSSVDSGNLWAALIVLQAAAQEFRDRPLLPPRLFVAIRETLAVIASLRERLPPASGGQRFEETFTALQANCHGEFSTARQAYCALRRVHRQARELVLAVPRESPELREWTQTLLRQCDAARRALRRLAFWVSFPEIGGRRWELFRNRLPVERQKKVLERLILAVEDLNNHCTLSQLPAAATRIAEHAESLLEVERRSSGSGGIFRRSSP